MRYKNTFCRDFIKKQISGLTGHIKEAGFPFDVVEWGKPDYIKDNGGNPGWWVYEQTAYWLDGFTRCAVISRNEKLLKKAEKVLYNVINNADKDGYLGPKFLKPLSSWNRWPHVVFFRALTALFDYNGDVKITDALENHYISDKADYTDGRNVINVEIMLWLYGKTGNGKLLKLAEDSYAGYNLKCTDDLCDKVALSGKKPYAHGVSYNEYSKLGAILYKYTGKEKYLKASVAAYRKIDKYFMLIDGCHCSDEFLISNDVMRSHETCCISDYTWSLNYMFEATGNSEYLDKIEKCVFNAGLGAITDNFRALQYFSCVNQVIADCKSNRNDFFKGNKWMSYRPNPGTECCPGNVNRFMPNYLLNGWKKEGNKVYLKLYGASLFEKEGLKIDERTDYPFRDTVTLNITANTPFILLARIPVASKGFEIKKDGEVITSHEDKGFASVKIGGNCRIDIRFYFDVEKHVEDNYVWFSRGAVVYANAVKTRKERDENEERQSKHFPAYNMYAAENWNYGVKGGGKIRTTADGISVDGYLINGWKIEKTDSVQRCINLYDKSYVEVKGDFNFTPRLPENPKAGERKRLKLIPYGFAKLRVAAFPKIKG